MEPRTASQLEQLFQEYRELAEKYWQLLEKGAYGVRNALDQAAGVREQLIMKRPEVEAAAEALGLSYEVTIRAAPIAGGFIYHRNLFASVYEGGSDDPYSVPRRKVLDFLIDCVARAKRGLPQGTPTPAMKTRRNKIAIGHGRSLLWRELKDFLKDELKLEPDEYSMVATAGYSRKERLQGMLDEAAFAFLVMTAEDEQVDGAVRARENVVHEAGLFQGRLRFEKAIILLEEGCAPFSNIDGLDWVPFQKGNIKAAFEEIRRVLKREKLIG